MEDQDESSTTDESRKEIRMKTIRSEMDQDLTCEVPTGEDEVCGTGQDPENGILVGFRPDSDTAECNVCLEQWYNEHTSLAERESQVFALKVFGRSAQQIVDLFENRFGEEAPSKSTVESHDLRARNKYFTAVRTALELGPVYDPDAHSQDENEAENNSEVEEAEA